MASWWSWLPIARPQEFDREAAETNVFEPCSVSGSGRQSPKRASRSAYFTGKVERSPSPVKRSASPVKGNSGRVASPRGYIVRPGDWLFDICRRNRLDVKTLLKANPHVADPDSLLAGSTLAIPALSSAESFVSPPKVKAVPTAGAVKPKQLGKGRAVTAAGMLGLPRAGRAEKHHVVRPGDSLEWIAEKFGTSVSTLQRLNGLKDDTIYMGDVLKVGGIQPARARTTKAPKVPVGVKATLKERNAVMNGFSVDRPQPVRAPMSENPMFWPPRLKRGRKGEMTGGAARLKTITVRFGDTLADLAHENKLSIRELQKLNNLRNENIFEGDVLAVTAGPKRPPPPELRAGVRRTTRRLFSRLTGGEEKKGLGIGGPEPPRVALGLERAKLPQRLEGRWKKKKGIQQRHDRWLRFNSPVTDGFVSSPFGWRWGAFHEGVDLAAEVGSPVLASDKGTVTYAGWSGGYGYLVAIQHEGGFVTRYAHCCAIHARVGQPVARGQQVAAVGATGHATGPHLHFEVRKNGAALDPFKWVNL